MLRKFLEKKIQKHYRKKWIKLLYGVLFFNQIKKNKFAKSNGVLEVLAYYRLSKSKISNDFVKKRFNKDAKTYDEDVTRGGYKNGEFKSLIEEISNQIQKRKIKKCLDLGCGSGLAAEQLNQFDIQILGVDISDEMIGEARRKNLYDELYCSEIENFLVKQRHQKIQLAFACSVIQFFDEDKLNNLFDLIRNILDNDGVFVFTFDVCPTGTRINQKLFMEHSPQFIKTKAEKYFNQVEVKHLPFGRIEQAKEVKCGLAVLSNRR